LFALRIDSGKHHQNVCSDLIVLGEVLEAVLLGYSFGLGLEPRVSLIKFSDHCLLLLRCDETLNLPLGEPDLFHPRHTPRPLRACRERPRRNRASNHLDEVAPSHAAPSGAHDHANHIQNAAIAPCCWDHRNLASPSGQDVPMAH